MLDFADGKVDQATEAFQGDLARDPRDAFAQTGLANVDLVKGDYAAAEAGYRRALEVDPRSVGAYLGLGWLLLNVRHDLNGAEAMFRKTLAFAPNASTGQIGLGRVQGERGEWNSALASFQAAIRAMPTDGYGHAWAGRALIRLGRYAEARPYLEQAKALIPDEPQVQQDLDELRRRGA
jgi:tetratricopeptide (TPR) repeat protein